MKAFVGTVTVAAFFGAAILPAPARAQQRTPVPPGGAGCDSCGEAGVDSLSRALARAQESLQRAESQLETERQALQESQDSTGAAQEAFARAAGEVRRAQERYRRALGQMMHHEMARARSDAEHALRVQREMMERSAPAGWLGLTFSGSASEIDRNGKTLVRFSDYPRVEAVDPDSPAERAGIEAQDRLVAIAGRDVTQGIEPFRALLTPGRRLAVTLRRGGETRTVMVTVARRPERAWADWGFSAPPAPPVTPTPPVFPAPAPPMPGSLGDEAQTRMFVAPFAAPRTAPDAGVTVHLDLLGPGASPIAGAELQQVGELRDYFGVRDGVLVLRVVPGTPAARSGLRGGDVILRANGKKVETPIALAHVMDAARENAVTLRIVRKRKPKTVVLRWDQR